MTVSLSHLSLDDSSVSLHDSSLLLLDSASLSSHDASFRFRVFMSKLHKKEKHHVNDSAAFTDQDPFILIQQNPTFVIWGDYFALTSFWICQLWFLCLNL